MKKILFVIVSVLFIVISCQARKVEGYYITNNNDTIKAAFFVTASGDYLIKFSYGILYDTNENSRSFYKDVLKPDVNKKVVFSLNGKVHELVSKWDRPSIYDPKTPRKIFLEVKDDDGYMFWGAVSPSKAKGDFLQKGNDSLFYVNVYQKEKTFEYFNDCPELTDDVKALFKLGGPYDFDIKLKKIVKKYNQNCGAKMQQGKQ